MPAAIQATLDTTAMSPQVPLTDDGFGPSSGFWSAIITWIGDAGTAGNGKKLSIAFASDNGSGMPSDGRVYVRDNYRYDLDAEDWIVESGTVGVLISTVDNGAIRFRDIEALINGDAIPWLLGAESDPKSSLCEVTTLDGQADDYFDHGNLAPFESSGTFSGGVDASLVDADGYARMLMALLPPGKVWRLVGSTLERAFLACADELQRLDARTLNLLDESVPSSAVELLPEYESELDLDGTGTTEERQARVVARLVARQRYRPEDFRIALAPLLGQDPDDVIVIERSRADAIAMADDREIYRFFIYRNPTAPGDYYLDSAQALVDKIKPSHTLGFVIESVDFLTDDEFSLTDRDILGA